MPRRKKTAEQPAETGSGGAPPAIGDNVSTETLRKFEREYVAAKTDLDEARGALGSLCKQAESDGIDVKVFKQIQKLKALLPPAAEAKLATYTNYTRQLGLFDQIEQYRQGIEREDNEASVKAAERAKPKGAKLAPAEAAKLEAHGKAASHAEPRSGSTPEACYAQGFEAGRSGAARDFNPHHGELHDDWDRGWVSGVHDKVGIGADPMPEHAGAPA